MISANARERFRALLGPQCPADVSDFLADFTDECGRVFDASLRSIVLFGSAAEGRLRLTSDLNLMCVFEDLAPLSIDRIRPLLRQGGELCRLRVMFVLKSEVPASAALFAVKFHDLKRRHVVLFGPDPLADLAIERRDLAFRARQTLTNLKLRMRAAYAWDGDNASRLSLSIADTAGPLRSSASAVLALSGVELGPREALAKAAAEAGVPPDVLANLSRAREEGLLTLESARMTHKALGDLCSWLLERAERESV